MIIGFSCQNYRSINEHQNILFTASKKNDEGYTLSTTAVREKVLPITALYGANGSGKTNLLMAISFAIQFIKRSAKKDLEGSKIPHFKLEERCNDSPQEFIIDFIKNNTHYQFGFSILGDEVVEEWLYSFSYVNRASKSLLFHRDEREKNIYQFGKRLKGSNSAIAKITNKHSLFLSVAAKSNHDFLKSFVDYFNNQYLFRFELDITEESIAENIEKYKLETEISDFISKVDVGAKGISIIEIEIDEKQLEFRNKLSSSLRSIFSELDSDLKFRNTDIKHEKLIQISRETISGETVQFNFSEESLGTKSLISLLVIIFRALKVGGVLVVDEIESSLHSLLSLKLVELFNNPLTNPNNAQLIFSTHETHLLNFVDVRRDQIWFTERCPNGATHIAALYDYQVPKSSNLRNGYLNGKFGGIPFLNDFSVSSLFKKEQSL